MTVFDTLYKKTKSGAIQQWTIIADGNTYWTESGQVNGKITVSAPTICAGKNLGKSNETTGEAQALKDAESKFNKQLKSKYTRDINAVDAAAERVFYPMLAQTYKPGEDASDNIFPCFAQPKLDGIRCIVKQDGAFTRKGERIHTVPHIIAALEPIFTSDPNAVFDGELYNHELKDDFEQITSLVKKTKPGIADLFDSAEQVQYYIYDCPRINGLDLSAPFFDRYTAAKATLQPIQAQASCIQIVPTYTCADATKLEELFTEFVTVLGYEGVMLRANAPYEHYRTYSLLKYKKFIEEEYRIADILPGRGNKSTWAARAKFRSKKGDVFYAGILGDREYCENLLANKDLVCGKLATVKFFSYTNKGIPRFPKLKALRWDLMSAEDREQCSNV